MRAGAAAAGEAAAAALGGRRRPCSSSNLGHQHSHATPIDQQQRRRRRRGGQGEDIRGGHRQLPLAAALLLLLLPLAAAAAATAPTPSSSSPSSRLRIFYPSAASDQSAAGSPNPRTAPLPEPHDPNRDGGRTAPFSAGLSPLASVTALYCPNGGALEGGKCYPRCRLGWRGAGCTCWRDGRTYARGCGQRPAVCEATSFRRSPLPPIVEAAAAATGGGDDDGGGGGFGGGDFTNAMAARGQSGGAEAADVGGGEGGSEASPGSGSDSDSGDTGSSSSNGGAHPPTTTTTTSITLVLSSDPQLFRNGSSPDARATAVANNRLLARSINRVRDLGEWPAAAGGGRVAEPRALVVLGDLTEAYREREADAFRHYYDPAFPGNEGERVRFPTWLMLGNHDYVNNAMGAVSAGDLASRQQQQEQRERQQEQRKQLQEEEERRRRQQEQQPPVEAPLSADYEALEEEEEEQGAGARKAAQKNDKRSSTQRRGNSDAPCSDKAAVAGDGAACAKRVVDEMRALLSPQCPTRHWSGFPKQNVTSFDADSMAYAFDYGRYHFAALHFSPRHRSARLGVAGSLAWLSRELSHASAQGRRVVVLVHSHGELGLADDPTFSRLIGAAGSPVVALFFGHIHVRPWGYAGTFPRTAVPMFNCGASWYNTYCVAEFAEEGMRVGAVSHGGDGRPRWFGHSAHLLPAPGAPLAGDGSAGGGAAAAAAARSTGVAPPPAKPALLAYEPNPKGSPWLRNGVVREER